MTVTEFVQSPDDKLDYIFNWTKWLAAGETITASTMTAPGLTITASSFSATNATVWVAGGVDGRPYKVTNKITTSQDRTRTWAITVRVRQS